jgi:radical SAM protein with 4Fe4S-binding SPASM domain
MVGLTIIGRRALRLLRDDLVSIGTLSSGSWTPATGLYTYDMSHSRVQRRFHLRVEPDGRGVLFVDVTDVIHLNQTATAMTKFALDGVPFKAARARILASFATPHRRQVDRDLRDVYEMVASLWSPYGDCPTCAVGTLRNAPMFSVSANAPYKVDLALTYGCNNACGHCYNEPDRFTMPSLVASEWYLVLEKLYQIGVPHVIFTGGEATLHPDLPKLIKHADSLGLVVGLNTNGRRIADRNYMDSLAEAGLNHVQVTLGSHRPEIHNAVMGARSFDQTVRGIKNAIASGVHCITNTTLMVCNKGHAADIVRFLHELGINTFAMNGMIYSGGGLHDPNAIPDSEMPPILVHVRDLAADLGMRFLWYTPTEYCRMSPVELEIGAKRCNAAEYSICVEPSGDILPCQSYFVAAGNILHDPWEKIWHGDLFRSFRERNHDPVASGLPEKCWDCPDLPLCGGGCRLEREAHASLKTINSDGTAKASCGGGCSINKRPEVATSTGFVASPGATSTGRRARGNQHNLLEVTDVLLIEGD